MFHIVANPYVFSFDTIAGYGSYVPPGGFLSTDLLYAFCATDPTTKKCGGYKNILNLAAN